MAGQRHRKKEPTHRGRTWTLVCVVLVAAAALFLRGVVIYKLYPLDYQDEIKKYSEEYALDPYFVSAVICAESGFDKTAVSNKGAMGLMQIMPDTGAWAAEKIGMTGYTTEMLFEPEINIRIGCWYFAYLSEMFGGDEDKMIAAYNAGPNNVREWAGDGKLTDIPFGQTKDYMAKVKNNEQVYKGLYNDF